MVGAGCLGQQTLRPGMTPEAHSQWDGYTGRDAADGTGHCSPGAHEAPRSLCVLDPVL